MKGDEEGVCACTSSDVRLFIFYSVCSPPLLGFSVFSHFYPCEDIWASRRCSGQMLANQDEGQSRFFKGPPGNCGGGSTSVFKVNS